MADYTNASNIRVDKIEQRWHEKWIKINERLDVLEKIVSCKATPVTNTTFFGSDAELERWWDRAVHSMVDDQAIPVHGDPRSLQAQREALKFLLRSFDGPNEPMG